MDDRKRHKANTLAASSTKHRMSGVRGNAPAALRSAHVVRGKGVVALNRRLWICGERRRYEPKLASGGGSP